ncbi:DUF2971 domain-containing protein [Roseomonas eburnea]|uniref:DUF2971 domain-containing protein n=1 Tax=Neoroseomonas eburnea TaxID=1346889 RepID=A0A9X9X6J8_9PROT|nr:hypothetical protein [Neoroseomonas eburnea]MBR0679334.1 DUF2971 domain-containing protein [Neoroseomonas eburnea]
MATLDKHIRRYTSISAVIDILRRRELPLLDPQNWDDRNDRYFMARYKEKKALGGLYALCAARCGETYHHWRVFTGTADGACIEIKRAPLEKALSKIPGVSFAEMRYLLLNHIDALTTADLDSLPFVKRIGFAAEEEYRIVYETDDPQGAAYSLEFPLAWISRIYLNPWLPDPLYESVKETLRALPDCAKLSIVKSRLIDSARWKNAGDRVIGKGTPQKKRALKVPSSSKS